MHPNQTLRLIRLRTQRRPYRGIRRQVHFFLVSCTRATLTYYVLGSPSLYNAVSVRRVVAYARLYMVLMPCFFFLPLPRPILIQTLGWVRLQAPPVSPVRSRGASPAASPREASPRRAPRRSASPQSEAPRTATVRDIRRRR